MHFGKQRGLLPWFTLTPEGIKPGKNKLKAIEQAKPPTNVKTICSFVGLCNFFWMHKKDFAIISALLFRLTCKDFGYKGPGPTMVAFLNLRKQLISEHVMAFPHTGRQYTLITDSATGTADTPWGTRSDPHTSRSTMKILCHLIFIQTTERP
jgi:hypothetical protein